MAGLGFSEDKIVVVDTKAALDKAIDDLILAKRIGIDIETVPTILKFQECLPSLVQLATSDSIFVIDLLAADEGFGAYAFDKFANLICNNPAILKIGQGLDNDVKILKKKFGVTGQIVDLIKKEIRNFVTLDDMFKSITGNNRCALDFMCETLLSRYQ